MPKAKTTRKAAAPGGAAARFQQYKILLRNIAELLADVQVPEHSKEYRAHQMNWLIYYCRSINVYYDVTEFGLQKQEFKPPWGDRYFVGMDAGEYEEAVKYIQSYYVYHCGAKAPSRKRAQNAGEAQES